MVRLVQYLLVGFCLLFAGSAGTQAGDGPADTAFYKGKTLTYIVATKAGGGYDAYARLIAVYLEKHLPGLQVKVQNVPGAGHLVGLNRLAVDRPDGLTIGTFNTGLIYSQILGLPRMTVDLRSLDWIGKAASDPRVMVVSAESGITDLADLRGRETPANFASSGVGTASHNETRLLTEALGLDIKIIPGYGGGEGEMAMLRGEIEGTVGSYSSLKPFLDNGYGRMILRIGGGDSGFAESVPGAGELVNDATGAGIVTVMRTLTEMGRMTAAPGGLPPERLAALRQAYTAALDDPGLRAEAARLQIPIDPLPGDVVAQRLEAALSQPPEVVAAMRRLTGKGDP